MNICHIHLNFFYSGGADQWPPLDTVHNVIKDAAVTIRSVNPDIVLLQEVDIGAKRTHYVNQIKLLLDLLPEYTFWVCTPTFRTKYFPYPRMLGKVNMEQCVISKYKITQATRYALPSKLGVIFPFQYFLPKRSLLEVNLSLAKGQPLKIINTHFSAYARNTDTLNRQISYAFNYLKNIQQEGGYAVLGGDFNSLPHATMHQYLKNPERRLYYKNKPALTNLLKRFQSAPSFADTQSNSFQRWFTAYSSYEEGRSPDMTIDYIFITDDLSFENYYVLNTTMTRKISDHLPVIAIIKIK